MSSLIRVPVISVPVQLPLTVVEAINREQKITPLWLFAMLTVVTYGDC